MKTDKKYVVGFWVITITLALVKVIFTLRPGIDLFTEEAQYWLWSQNMAWHYYSKPPLVAVLNYLSTGILGNTELGVRINAILCGVGIAWVTYLFAKHLYGSRAGFWAALVVQAMPVWWLASTFHMTDSSLTLFWTLAVYLAYRGIQGQKTSWWVWAGVATAFGLMAKMVMLLIFPAVLIFLLFNRSFKLHRKNFIVFFGVSLLGFVPALIWNWENNFDTFKHLATLGGAGGGESKSIDLGNSLKWFLEYFSGQLAIISPFLLPVWFSCFRDIFKNKAPSSVYLALPGILAFLAFAMLSLVKRVEVNWPVFAYVGFAVFLGNWIIVQSPAWRNFSKVAVLFSVGIPVLFLLPDITFFKSITPVQKGEQKALSRLTGHGALARRLEYLKDSLKLENEFYFSDSYHTASELSFYLPGHPQSYVLNMGARKNQFDLWADMSQFIGEDRVGIFVSMNFEEMENRATFERLIYEESFTPFYQEIPIRNVKIQVWEELKSYQPFVPDTY